MVIRKAVIRNPIKSQLRGLHKQQMALETSWNYIKKGWSNSECMAVVLWRKPSQANPRSERPVTHWSSESGHLPGRSRRNTEYHLVYLRTIITCNAERKNNGLTHKHKVEGNKVACKASSSDIPCRGWTAVDGTASGLGRWSAWQLPAHRLNKGKIAITFECVTS